MTFAVFSGCIASSGAVTPSGRNLYWVGGAASWNGTATGKWSLTSGGASGEAIPTSIDNVFFDAASGVVTVTAATTAFNCANLDFTGFTGTFAGSIAGSIYGNLTLATGMTRTYSGTLTFKSTSTGNTITCNGKTLASSMTFNGVGGAWTLQDTLNIGSSSITLTNGALDTNGKAVTASSINSSNSNVRSLTLGASTLTLSSSLGLNTSTNLTFSGASSTINITGTGSIVTGAALTFGTVNFTGTSAGPIINNTSGSDVVIGTLTRTNTSGYVNLLLTGNITVSTALTLTGNNANTQRLGILNNGDPTVPVVITCNGSISLTNVDFMGITGAGSATWSGTSLGNCGGNTGITFTGAVTRYLVASAGSNDFMASIWSTSTGGATGASRPLVQDTVVIDGSSFGAGSETLTVGGYRIPGLDFTNATNTPTLDNAGGNFNIFGDLKLIAGMSLSGTSQAIFQKQSGTQTLTSAGKTLPWVLIINTGGTVTLADALASATIGFFAGTFNDGNFGVTAPGFQISTTAVKVFNKGTGTYTLTGAGAAWIAVSTNITFTDSGTIKFTNNSGTAKNVTAAGLTYNNFWNATSGTGVCVMNNGGGNSTWSDFKVDAARTQQFVAGTTTNIATLTASGSIGNLTVLASSTAASHTLNFTALPIAVSFMSISRSNATGAAAAATSSTDGGNNTGWVITP